MNTNPSLARTSGFEISPLTPETWANLEKLFGPRGACGGCWCMFFRLPSRQWVRQKGDANKAALLEVVRAGSPPPGLLAYDGGEAVGWCALAPREQYPRLARSRILKPVDEQPVWSITCFFVKKTHRRRGVTLALLNGAVSFARQHGAKIIEGYPIELKTSFVDAFYYHGAASTFRKAAFTEVARRSPTRPIFRREL